MARTTKKTEAPLGKTLFKIAGKLRKNMDAAEYKHVILRLIFLKYIADVFGYWKVTFERPPRLRGIELPVEGP